MGQEDLIYVCRISIRDFTLENCLFTDNAEQLPLGASFLEEGIEVRQAFWNW